MEILMSVIGYKYLEVDGFLLQSVWMKWNHSSLAIWHQLYFHYCAVHSARASLGRTDSLAAPKCADVTLNQSFVMI